MVIENPNLLLTCQELLHVHPQILSVRKYIIKLKDILLGFHYRASKCNPYSVLSGDIIKIGNKSSYIPEMKEQYNNNNYDYREM